MKSPFFALIAGVLVTSPTLAETTYPATCSAISKYEVQQRGATFTGYYNADFYYSENAGRGGTSLCISHKKNMMDCTTDTPGITHVVASSQDVYFDIPRGEVAEIILADGKLTCTLK